MSRAFLLSLVATLSVACTTASTTKQTTVAATLVAPTSQGPAPEIELAKDASQATRERLLSARQQNLARLKLYIDAGAFPKNQVQPGLLNVFQDDDGHLCAVANLINLDGHTKLIGSTALANNYIVLATLNQGPLVDWILDSGFTQEEIAAIQVPYMGELGSAKENQVAPILAQQELNNFREQEVKRLQSALGAVHSQLVANTASSIEVALLRINPPQIAAR